jgi:hypothetical protein
MARDGTIYQSMTLRVMATISYLLFASAGATFIISDNLTPAYGPTAEIMSLFLLIGGLTAAVGTSTLFWAGEFVGIPLLGTGLIALGIQVWWKSEEFLPWLAAGNLLLLLAVATIMYTRWRQVLAIYWVAQTTARGRNE